MDTTKPAVQIFYGKYIDQVTNEFPSAHIDPLKNRSFELTLEPGKPNFPTVDTAEITLRNLDESGAELYPASWFLTNSRSAAEGAVLPFEMFFQVYIYGEAAFAGVYQEKTYSKNRDDVTITISSIIGLFDRSDKMLKELTFSNAYLKSSFDPSGVTFTALDSTSLNFERLEFNLEQFNVKSSAGTDGAGHITDLTAALAGNETLQHFNLDIEALGFDTTPSDNVTSSITQHNQEQAAWIKIGDNTILTSYTLFVEKSTEDEDLTIGQFKFTSSIRIYIHLWHAANANYSTADELVLQRGRFFADGDGAELSSGSNYPLTIFSPDQGAGDCVIKDSDILSTVISVYPREWMHGVRINETATNTYSIQGSELNKDYFDVFDLTLNAISEYFNNFYNTPGNADYFDISNSGTKGRKAFLADAIFFNWIGDKNSVKDILVSLARQTNCYLYCNGSGQIVFQSREQFETEFLAETIPAAAVDLDAAPFQVTAGESEDFGFDTYELQVPIDLIEVNNLISTSKKAKFINDSGEVANPGLRNTSLELSNYRVSDLAVPDSNYISAFGEWRKSPADTTFPDYTADLINEFLFTAEQLGAAYAARYIFPTTFLYLALPGQNFADLEEGGYMHRSTGTIIELFLVTKITRTSDLFKRVELKKETEFQVAA